MLRYNGKFISKEQFGRINSRLKGVSEMNAKSKTVNTGINEVMNSEDENIQWRKTYCWPQRVR